jgi:hypothetical protein
MRPESTFATQRPGACCDHVRMQLPSRRVRSPESSPDSCCSCRAVAAFLTRSRPATSSAMRVSCRADLQRGSTGEMAARLVHKHVDLEGVAGAHGDVGRHVWIYTTSDATSAEASDALSALRADPSVGPRREVALNARTRHLGISRSLAWACTGQRHEQCVSTGVLQAMEYYEAFSDLAGV